MPATAPWGETTDVLHLIRRTNRCTTLGPGIRAVLWVQGCPLRCPGCVAPETLPFDGGSEVNVASLAEELATLSDIEGVTFSGGEPMAQAAALSHLIDSLHGERDLSFMSYTGYTLGFLQRHGTEAQRALLDRLDILVDGPYIAERHTDLRWRGSDNQRVHFLSERYRHLVTTLEDRGTWIELECEQDGSLHWMGIPPRGFREQFEDKIAQLGIQ